MLEKIIALSQIKITDKMSEKQIAAAKNHNFYYQTVLTNIHEGKKTPFSWTAGILSTTWMLYRKMYVLSFLISLPILITSFLHIITQSHYATILSKESVSLIYLVWFVIATIGFGFIGNKLYYRHLLKKAENNYEPGLYSARNIPLMWIMCGLGILNGIIGTLKAMDNFKNMHIDQNNTYVIYSTIITLLIQIAIVIYDSQKTRKVMAAHELSGKDPIDSK